MTEASDPALDKMTQVIWSLVEIMRQQRMPAVDFQDERVVLLDGGRGAVGIGEASGPDRAKRAIEQAIADLGR